MDVNPSQEFDFSFALKRAPTDSSGFIKSFLPTQLSEAKDFFSEYGFMVISEALTPSECEASINDIWQYLEKEEWRGSWSAKKLKVSRQDPETWWSEFGWPEALSNEGILGGPPVFTHQALKNRMNKLLYDIGRLFYESDDVIVSHDRYGLFRPTKKVKDGFKWITDFNIHIDMNPWNYFDSSRMGNKLYSIKYDSDSFTQEFNSTGHYTDKTQVKLQALYNFVDNAEEDGGFQVIPGMHNHLKEWTLFTENTEGFAYKDSTTDFIPLFWKISFGLQNPVNKQSFEGIGKYAQRVTAKAGSLIVWSQFLPHGSAPNNSENIRMAQFCKIGSASQIRIGSRIQRARLVAQRLEDAGFKLENLGEMEQKLMGLDV